MAREFGYARSEAGRGRRAAIRRRRRRAWRRSTPTCRRRHGRRGRRVYDPKLEPHALGSVLVSAVFEAFTTVVRRKTERFFRIAGLDPQALGRVPLSDALVKAIAQEASDVAGQFLNICIRAIDYCPPADMELGEYLRALITADGELERSDKWGFREALMRSFRRREIFPDHVQLHDRGRGALAAAGRAAAHSRRSPSASCGSTASPGQPAERRGADAPGARARRVRHRPEARASASSLVAPGRAAARRASSRPRRRSVQSVRVTRRAAPDGRVLFDLVAEVTQSCTVKREGELFDVNGGCTRRHRSGGRGPLRDLQELRQRGAAGPAARRDARTAQAVLEEVRPEVPAAAARPAPAARREVGSRAPALGFRQERRVSGRRSCLSHEPKAMSRSCTELSPSPRHYPL